VTDLPAVRRSTVITGCTAAIGLGAIVTIVSTFQERPFPWGPWLVMAGSCLAAAGWWVRPKPNGYFLIPAAALSLAGAILTLAAH